MKLDSKNSDNMNTSSKRDKSVDKKEKLKLDKEKKEREKQEKKERELIEKQKKEQEKNLKKSGQQNVSSSATSSDLNKLTKQTSKEVETSKSTGLSSSKSENVLNILKKPTMSIFGSSNNKKQPNNDKQQKLQSQSNLLLQQQQMIPKGRFRCQVVYLDESVKTFDLDKNAIGEDLMTMVANDLELYEKEYFSLTYRDINNMKFWIDHEKKIRSQLKGQISSQEPVFSFEVKFYPPEPNVLQEEITRYLLTLQLRHDIMDGKLPCTYVTHALLGSFTVQAEVGDYDEVTVNNARMNGLTGYEYLDGFCFAPNQTPELLAAIAECHKDHIGQTPAEAEMHFLENAVKLAMYGVDLHNAKDSDGVDILIGVSSSGLLVHRDHLRINRFAWPKILKISYKRNHFYLKLRSGEFEKYETTIGFRCPNHKSAKRLWKISVEHHAFFRLREPEPKKSTLIPNFNAKYRYTGSSTYMQARHRSIERSQPAFTRSLSKRLTQSMDRGLALQNPSDTPGSVQSAAFNHFNRMKQHVSIGNIPKQNTDFRESQEDLEEGDYDLNDDVNINIPNRNYQNQPYQQNKPINTQNPSIKYVNNNNLNQNQGANTLDKVIRDPTSSYRSTASYNQIPNQFNNNNNINNININNVNRIPNQNYNQNQQLEEYYTSVDKNFQNDENRMPSIKQSIGDTIATLSGMNKISTPLASPSPAQLQQSQRYVPARQISQEQNQNRGPTVSNRSVLNSTNLNTQSIPLVDSDNSDISVFDENSKSGNSNSNNKKSNPQYVDDKLPPKPVNQQLVNQQKAVNTATVVKQQINTLDSVKYEYNSREVTVKKNEDIRNILNKNFEKYEKNLNYLVDSDPNRGSSIRSGYNQPIQSQSPINSQRYQNQQIPTTNSSIRSMEQSYNPNSSQQQLPQPTVRARQQPPPIPADRSVINTRQNDSSRYQQILDQQFSDRQKPQISSSSAKQATSSATSFIKTNETSRSGSISSTPDVTRVKKLVLVNEEINHKDLLLRAIQMATDLDPNLEVEKVEISAED